MKKILSSVIAVIVVASLVACGGDDDPGAAPAPKNTWSSGTSSATEQLDGGCNTSGIVIKGGLAAGEACEVASDCAPVCCACPGGSRAWAASSCAAGKCADEATACASTTDASAFCGP